MITLVTGPLYSGKSTALLSLLFGEQSAGGVVQRKLTRESDGFVVGYDLVSLRDSSVIPFARSLESVPADWDGGPQLGRFSFSVSGTASAIACIRRDLADGCHPVAIDEIGRLELMGEGLAPVLDQLKATKAILVVRDCFMTAIMERLDILPADCRIITCVSSERRDTIPYSHNSTQTFCSERSLV